jgi:hypothetical protein
MIYTFVGASGSGRSAASLKLGRYLYEQKQSYTFIGGPDIGDFTEGIAVGLEASYNTELLIATARIQEQFNETVMWHYDAVIRQLSLIDSLAYAMSRFKLMEETKSVDPKTLDRWFTTVAMIYRLAEDYLGDGLYLQLPLANDADEDTTVIHVALEVALEELGLKYKIIDPAADPETWLSN